MAIAAVLVSKIASKFATLAADPGAHHWRIELLELLANVNGAGDIIISPEGWLLDCNLAAARMFRLPDDYDGRGDVQELLFERGARSIAKSIGSTLVDLAGRAARHSSPAARSSLSMRPS